MPIDRSEVAVLIGPFVPDVDIVVEQILDVRVSLEEPQQFVDDSFQVEFLGGEQGESLLQIVARLCTEDAQRARTGAVAFLDAFFENAVKDI